MYLQGAVAAVLGEDESDEDPDGVLDELRSVELCGEAHDVRFSWLYVVDLREAGSIEAHDLTQFSHVLGFLEIKRKRLVQDDTIGVLLLGFDLVPEAFEFEGLDVHRDQDVEDIQRKCHGQIS